MENRRKFTEEETQSIIHDFHEGMNTVQLAKKYNRNNTNIGRLLKRNGLSARNIKSKMTNEQIEEAYKLYTEEFYTTEKLGVLYEVDANTIANSFRRLGFTVRSNGHIPEKIDNNFFDVIDTEAKAYFLGFIMCDGSIINDKGHLALHIELQERDREILDVFAKAIGLSPERVKTYTRIDKETPLTTVKVSINSDKLCSDLIAKGVIRKKVGNKKIPADVPGSLLKHTIRGMFDADGSLYLDEKSFKIYGGGKMTNEISNCLFDTLKLSKKPFVSSSNPDKVPYMRTYAVDFEKVSEYLYRDASIYLSRKYPF